MSNSVQAFGLRLARPQDRTELDDDSLRFRHDPLASQGRGSIRLMELLPCGWDEEICCKIFEVGLKALSSYDAISYTWGDDQFGDPGQPTDFGALLPRTVFPIQHSIRCNGKIISVSTNLYNALRRLREHRSLKCLWIDFLCIDQTDVRERNEQVQKMRQIYGNARMVPIWLGDLTIMALKMIKKFNQSDSAAQDYQIRAGDIYDPDAMLALGLPTFRSPEWEALHKLFER